MLKIQEFFKRIVEIDKEGQKEPNPEKPFEKQYIAREQLVLIFLFFFQNCQHEIKPEKNNSQI